VREHIRIIFSWLLLSLVGNIHIAERFLQYQHIVQSSSNQRLKSKNYLFSGLVCCACCNILFAFSNSCLREAGKPFPARFMKYCIIRIPEPIPLGLTFFEAMCRAIVSASLVNMPFFGKVDSVVTFLTHRFLLLLLDFFLDGGILLSSVWRKFPFAA
jgi:hypothetical protein